MVTKYLNKYYGMALGASGLVGIPVIAKILADQSSTMSLEKLIVTGTMGIISMAGAAMGGYMAFKYPESKGASETKKQDNSVESAHDSESAEVDNANDLTNKLVERNNTTKEYLESTGINRPNIDDSIGDSRFDPRIFLCNYVKQYIGSENSLLSEANKIGASAEKCAILEKGISTATFLIYQLNHSEHFPQDLDDEQKNQILEETKRIKKKCKRELEQITGGENKNGKYSNFEEFRKMYSEKSGRCKALLDKLNAMNDKDSDSLQELQKQTLKEAKTAISQDDYKKASTQMYKALKYFLKAATVEELAEVKSGEIVFRNKRVRDRYQQLITEYKEYTTKNLIKSAETADNLETEVDFLERAYQICPAKVKDENNDNKLKKSLFDKITEKRKSWAETTAAKNPTDMTKTELLNALPFYISQGATQANDRITVDTSTIPESIKQGIKRIPDIEYTKHIPGILGQMCEEYAKKLANPE